jgi:O-antigen/teichoic acid export membrane protein
MTARAFLNSGLSSGLILGVGVVTGILAARSLGPADRGHFGTILAWSSLFGVLASLSIGDVVLLQMKGGHDEDRIAAWGRSLVRVAIAIAWPAGAGLIWVLVYRQGELVALLGIAVWSVQLLEYCTTQLAFGRLRHEHRFSELNILRITPPAVYLLFASLSAYLAPTLTGFVAAHAGALLVTMAMRRYLTRSWYSHPQRWEWNSDLLRAALPLHAVTVLTATASVLDRLLVITTASPAAVGIYLVAGTLATPIQGVLRSAIQSIALPVLLRRAGTARANVALRLLRVCWLASLGGAGAVAVAAPLAVPVLFGESFVEAGAVTTWLALAVSLSPVRAVQVEILKSEGFATALIAGEIVFISGLALSFGAAFLLTVPWPVVWGLGIAHLAATLFLSHFVQRALPAITLRSWIVPRYDTVIDSFKTAQSLLDRRSQPSYEPAS